MYESQQENQEKTNSHAWNTTQYHEMLSILLTCRQLEEGEALLIGPQEDLRWSRSSYSLEKMSCVRPRFANGDYKLHRNCVQWFLLRFEGLREFQGYLEEHKNSYQPIRGQFDCIRHQETKQSAF